MDEKRANSGLGAKAKVLMGQLIDGLLNPDKIADAIDSIRRFRSNAVQIIGLPTKDEVTKVEDLIARSQSKLQKLQGSVAKLESLIAEKQKPKTPAPTAKTAKKVAAAVRPAARHPRPSNIGKKPPSTLLDIDIGKRRKR